MFLQQREGIKIPKLHVPQLASDEYVAHQLETVQCAATHTHTHTVAKIKGSIFMTKVPFALEFLKALPKDKNSSRKIQSEVHF